MGNKSKAIVLGMSFLCAGIAYGQSFTNCIPYVAGRPDQGMNCSTTSYGNNGGGNPLFIDPAKTMNDSYNATSQMLQGVKNGDMVNRARRDCNNGVARACEYLKQNNVY